MKKLWRVFFLTIALCLITALSVSAKGDVKKVTKTVNPSEGTGKPITIITANKFLVDERVVLFEFESEDAEYLSNAFCTMTTGDVEEGDGEWIQNQNGTFYARCNTDGELDCGKYTINIKINNYNSDAVYRTSIEVEICDSFAPLAEMDGLTIEEKQTISKYDSGMNISVYSFNEVYPSKIVLADKNGTVYMATENSDNIYCNSTGYIKNVYYTDVFKEETLDCLEGIDGYYIGGYMRLAKALNAGSYNLVVYNEDKTASAKLENAVTVVDNPSIEFRSNGSNYLKAQKAGDEMFWISAEMKGASPTTINKISMYDDNGNLFAQSTGDYIVENYNYHERNVVFEMEPVSGEFKYGKYRIELDTTTDFYCPSYRLYISENTNSNIYINRVTYPNPEIANFVVKLSNANPTSQYKFELYDNKNALLSEEYVNVSEDGTADIEFTDADGKIISITPGQRYNIYFYSKVNGEWKRQSQYGVSTYYEYSTSSGTQGFSAYVEVYGGVVEASLSMPQSMQGSYAGNNFVIKVLSIGGQEYTFTPSVDRYTSTNGTHYISLEVENANLPDGLYTAALYYNSREIVPYEEWYNFSMTTPDAGGNGEGINHTRYTRRIYFDNLTTVTNPTLKLYNVLDGDFEPEHIISLVKNGEQYYIPETAKFDKNLRYYYEIIANGEVYAAEFNQAKYFSNQQYDTSKSCTVTVKQTANGTTSVSNTTPNVGDTVYVYTNANDGYQYKPLSVKVNGVRIQGRSFVIFEDATVEVEYREIPVTMYKATAQNYSSSYGEIAVEKEYYKPGETVKVSVKLSDNNYKVNRLRYRDMNYNWTDIDLTTKTFKMPEHDIIIEAGYTRKSTRYINKENYSEYSIKTYYNGSEESNIMEGESVTVTAYLNSTRKELPASEFEELYYVLSSDSTGKHYPISNGIFTMPSENIKIYGTLRKRPISAEITGKGSVVFKKGYSGEVTEAYATESITVEGKGVGSFRLTSIEVNGVSQTSNTFEMPAGKLDLKVNFTSDKFMKVSALPCENGRITFDTANWEYEEGLDYVYGKDLVIKVKPNKCYKLKSLIIGETDYIAIVEDNQLIYDIDSHQEELVVTAEFELAQYEVNYVDYNNNIIANVLYDIGEEGVYEGATPYRAPDENYAYIFTGWDKESVTDTASVYAQYEAVPYTKIENEEQLKAITGNGYYFLMNDITLSGKWTPIETFSGVLDGNGHKISNIDPLIVEEYHSISIRTTYYSGFFKNLNGTVINLAFEVNGSGELDKDDYLRVGAIAAEMSGARIENCYVKGSMNYIAKDTVYAGVMAGYAYSGEVRNCYTEVDISVNSDKYAYVAGLAYVENNINLFTSYGNSTVQTGTNGKAYIFVNDYNRAYSCFYNSEKRNGATVYGASALTTAKFKLLSSYVFSNKCTWDFGKVWNLDNTINGGLPSLKTFGTNQITATTESSSYSNRLATAKINFSAPIKGMTFVKAYGANGKVLNSEMSTITETYNTLDVEVEVKEKPEDIKVFVWENIANIKPVVMETLEIE